MEWKKTGCVLCAQNCGLEVLVEDNRITKVRSDKENPRSLGYICRKGRKIAHFQHHEQRLTHPMKREGKEFQNIGWDRALNEIAEKLEDIVDQHGPRSLAYMGGGGQGCHFEAAYGVRLLRSLGSRYRYSALAQELTGMFWVQGRAVGRQYLHTLPDERHTDMLLCIGWNPWLSHQMPRARKLINDFAKDPNRLIVVIDPRKTKTAKKADIHLSIRPGTDALLTRAMIAIVLEEGWQDAEYVEKNTNGFDEILPLFEGFDFESALKVCELDVGEVREVTRLFATRRSSMHPDLGTLMSRHSTATSYLHHILLALCGRIGVSGGNVFPGYIMPLGSHSDERDERNWRTVATGYPGIMGTYPPNVMPEEIVTEGPERLRAVIVSGSNPLRSYADTRAYEKAFSKLDLLVTVEVAMSETASLSHYVLPARSAYEKWDSSFFAWTYPEVYFQMRRPVVEPAGEPLEEGEIFTRLASKLGLLPEIPNSLYEAAKGDRQQYGQALFGYISENPGVMKLLPFILAKTLGKALGSYHLSALWGLLQTVPDSFRKDAERAGFPAGPGMGEALFEAVVDHPEGLWIGKCDPLENLKVVRTESGRIDLVIPELLDWVRGIDSESEEEALKQDADYPLILMAGRHVDENANTLMRDPAWNEGRRAYTLTMHPSDAQGLGLVDGETVMVSTEAGKIEIELELTDKARPGHVTIPHGQGLIYEGKEHGANVNRLTKNTHRDRIAATPLHKYVPCRVTAA